MNEQKQYVCPWCGGKDVVEGIQSTYAKVQPNKALTLKGENLIHVICKNCGTAAFDCVGYFKCPFNKLLY